MAFYNIQELHDNRLSDSIPYYSFYDSNGNLISGEVSVSLNRYGQFDVVTSVESGVTTTYNIGEYTYTTECLYVLGIGFIIPGDKVKLKITDRVIYTVGFGWHTNSSNQTIYSWYLTPEKVEDYTNSKNCLNEYRQIGENDIDILTLYKEYLDTIEVVEFVKNRTTFNIDN